MRKLKKIFRTADIVKIDQYTIGHEPINSIDLMERASGVFVENLLKEFLENNKFVVVAGWGNNGGDGFAVARLLLERGHDVTVCKLAGRTQMSPDCEVNYNRWKGKTVEIVNSSDFLPDKDAVLIDALFGSGLNRKVEGIAASLIRRINELKNTVIALDIPSGLMGEDNTDNDREAIVRADYTYTFQFPKVAFMLPENSLYVGKWKILDIGLHDGIMASLPASYYYLTWEAVVGMLPEQKKFAHKGTNGHGLLVAGSYGMMGAAVLASRAAVRSGIGLLSCHVPTTERHILHIAVPEILVEPEFLLSDRKIGEKYSAVAMGPGIGKNSDVVNGLRKLLVGWKGVTVLDADALNILADHLELLDFLHEGCILTPHIREFERLTGKCENDFERLNKLSIFATRYKICVILKGAHTVIASPDGSCYFNMTGNPGMAKGGAGDVLTGVILALVANGIAPLKAALIGVFAHGLSGDLQAEEKGMRGICAGDLADGMGRAWKELENFSG